MGENLFRGSEMPDAKEGCGRQCQTVGCNVREQRVDHKDAGDDERANDRGKVSSEYHHMQNFCRKNAIFPAMVKRTRGGEDDIVLIPPAPRR
jgi:hypothetical protein